MNLVKWDPLRDIEDVTTRVIDLLANPLRRRDGGRESLTVADWAPAVDISETAEAFCLKVELPDVSKEDVHVTLDGDLLTIAGELRQTQTGKDTLVHRVECSYGAFWRSFHLPSPIDAGAIDAQFKDGMLTVKLPKTEVKAVKGIEISIH